MSFGILNIVKLTTNDKKPQYWGLGWPLHSFILRERSKSDLLLGFRQLGFKIILCCTTNNKVKAALASIDPWLTAQRYISKAQNLNERLQEIGIDNFVLSYYEAASPYALGALDELSTLQTLKARLAAKGFEGYDYEEIFRQEFHDFDAPTLDASSDVLCFTNTKFLSMLTARRRTWWDELGLSTSTRMVDDIWDPDGPMVEAPKAPEKLVVVFDDPPLREFDKMRLVKPKHVEDLKASVRTRRKTKQPPGRLPGYQPLERHEIVKIGDDHFEIRPQQMEFCRGLRRGCRGPASPKLLILTPSESVAHDATATLRKREAVYRMVTKERPITDLNLLMGLVDEPLF